MKSHKDCIQVGADTLMSPFIKENHHDTGMNMDLKRFLSLITLFQQITTETWKTAELIA